MANKLILLEYIYGIYVYIYIVDIAIVALAYMLNRK